MTIKILSKFFKISLKFFKYYDIKEIVLFPLYQNQI